MLKFEKILISYYVKLKPTRDKTREYGAGEGPAWVFLYTESQSLNKVLMGTPNFSKNFTNYSELIEITRLSSQI